MILKLTVLLTFICGALSESEIIPIGVITRKGDITSSTVISYILWSQQRAISEGSLQHIVDLLETTVEEETAVSYHQAVCRLLAQGIVGLIAPVSPTFYPILAAYSQEFQFPLITPEIPDVSGELTAYAFGIRPSTTRAILSLIQHYEWKDIVYLYDHDYGPEKIQHIFTLGYRALRLNLVGILRITSAEDANNYLRKLHTSGKLRPFHVILDTDSALANDILLRHKHDIHVGKRNFHFILTQPELVEFWIPGTNGVLNVTGFLAINPDLNRVKNFKKEWKRLNSDVWQGAGSELNVSSYYYHDIGLILLHAQEKIRSEFLRGTSSPAISANAFKRDCLQNPPVRIPYGMEFAKHIREVKIQDAATGRIQFDANGLRENFDLNIVEANSKGVVGTWSGVLRINSVPSLNISTVLPLIRNNGWLRVTTKTSPPYMMLKTGENSSELQGNDRFEGFCKDILDILSKQLNFEYELKLVEDDTYGRYYKDERRWSGLIGEIIQGKADIAFADLAVSGERQRVVDFTDPYAMVGFSLVMKNPHSVLATSSMFFFLSAFSASVWICILVAVVLFALLLHLITKFTAAPDTIESAGSILGRKLTFIVTAWFSVGSSMMQDTGIYPRSISSRILSGIWWFFTLILSCMFIASITAQLRADHQTDGKSPQLSQLKALSLESIVLESLSRGWPKIGILYPSNTAIYMKKSTLPVYQKYANFMKNNPDVKFSTLEEGLEKVRKSKGGFMLFLESLTSDYVIRQKPCDLVATHDAIHYAGYGIATQMGSPLRSSINAALSSLKQKGVLGHLHRKWWIETIQCKNEMDDNISEGTLHSFSGLFCVTVAGFFILLVIFGIQYMRKSQRREDRRQQLSFEDMNLGHTLPTPPPELLAEPPPVLNLPEYDKRTLL